MIKVDVSDGEAVLIRFADGTELYVHQNVWERRLSVRLSCEFGRRIRWRWLQGMIAERLRDALLCEVDTPG